MHTTTELLIGAASALGGGLLIGLERERRKGQGPGRAPAGIRTFGLAALAGFAARALEEPYLVAAGTLFLVVVAGIAAWRDRSSDPGITTELALLVTYLLGSLAIDRPIEAAGAAVVVTALLIGRRPLHAFSVDVLTAAELRDGLLFAAAALILLPLLPDRGLSAWPAFNPHRLWKLVVLFMGLQAAGYIAVRAAGTGLGLALSGFATGFASSTGTIAALGVRARQDPSLATACIAGALGSTLATVVLLGAFAVAISPPCFERLLPSLAAGILAALAIALLLLWRSRGQHGTNELSGRAFNLPYAIGFAALLSGVTAIVSWANGQLGHVAATGATALAAVFDVHAAAASVFTLAATRAITPEEAVMPVLIAWSVNAATKGVAAFSTGGLRYGTAVSTGVGCSLAAAWAAWLLVPR